MRVQSILSSFVIILGSFVLHLTLAVLAWNVKWPSSEEMDSVSAILAEGDYECVSQEELEASVNFCKYFHTAAAAILFYMDFNTLIWMPFAILSKEKNCCRCKKVKIG